MRTQKWRNGSVAHADLTFAASYLLKEAISTTSIRICLSTLVLNLFESFLFRQIFQTNL